MEDTSVLFLTKYDRMGPTSRYRVHQYLDYLQSSGVRCTLRPLLTDAYLKRIFVTRSRAQALLRQLPSLGTSLTKRWLSMTFEAHKHDVVYVEYECLPYLPYAMEAGLFRRARRVIVDFDDPISINYERSSRAIVRKLLAAKIPRVISSSSHVIVANQVLADWYGEFNPNISIIPTSVDLTKYQSGAGQLADNPRPVIGWIGMPTSSRYLRHLERPLRALKSQHDFVLKVIGSPGFQIEGVEVLNVPWSEETEYAELSTCDIGVMPIPNEIWGRGKSALKLIQYMAAGVASVASPVGANCDVLGQGAYGYLAGTDDEWVDTLSLLIRRPDLRRAIASAGRRVVEERYSIQANAPRLLDVIRGSTLPDKTPADRRVAGAH